MKAKPRRRLLSDVFPDEEDQAREVQRELNVYQQVMPHSSVDWYYVNRCGVTYQKCGGGRRVIRRGKGD